MSDLQMHTFDDRAALDRALADHVASLLRSAIEERGDASLVVSGGSTPKGFFRLLSEQDLDWPKLLVTLADDRWVPADHEDSNERLVRDNLLRGSAAQAGFLPLVTQDAHPDAAEGAIDRRLAQLGTADVVILGMGNDGHFASLFPGSSALGHGLDTANTASCAAVDPPIAQHLRMSMTLRRLLDTRRLILHIVGEEKRRVLSQAMEQGDVMALPIAAVLQSDALPLAVYWAP